MTGADCQQVHQELVLMLNDLNLGWVVEQAAHCQILDLIDTIERLVLDTQDMEHELIDFLATVQFPATVTLSFASEGQLVETVEESSDRRREIAELRPLLNTLRQEVS